MKIWVGHFKYTDVEGEEYEHMILALTEVSAQKHIAEQALSCDGFGWDTDEGYKDCRTTCQSLWLAGKYEEFFDRINEEGIEDGGFSDPIELTVYEQEVLD